MGQALRVVIVFNEPLKSPGDLDAESEAGVLDSVAAIESALTDAGHRTLRLGLVASLDPLLDCLRGNPPDVAVNLVEAFAGRGDLEPAVAGVFELFGVPYTGSSSEALGLVRNKARTKLVFLGAGIPTAEAWTIGLDREILREVVDALATGPLFVKPACSDASEGILLDSVVEDEIELVQQVRRVHDRYGAALVERFIDGREFNVGILDLGEPIVLPLAEMEFQVSAELPWRVITYNAKWKPDSPEDTKTQVRCPANVDRALADSIRRVALAAYSAVGVRDYARVDIRVDRREQPYVLEVNANPDLDPQVGLARELRAAGWSYEQFVVRLVEFAASRGPNRHRDTANDSPVVAASNANGAIVPSVAFRDFVASDIDSLIAMTQATGVFRPDEINVAAEILEEALKQPHAADGYRVLVAASDDRVVGWSCHGRVPLTDGSFDLYWIVVTPDQQGRGVGRALLERVESEVRQLRGRWLFAETSAQAAYEPTREFYRKNGFQVVRESPDFYRAGDGLVVFGKRL